MGKALTKADRARIRLEYKLIDRLGAETWEQLKPHLSNLEWEIRKECVRTETIARNRALKLQQKTLRRANEPKLPQITAGWSF